MWGINGAFSVLGSIVAVAISIFAGIHTNLLVAGGVYALLTVPLTTLTGAVRGR